MKHPRPIEKEIGYGCYEEHCAAENQDAGDPYGAPSALPKEAVRRLPPTFFVPIADAFEQCHVLVLWRSRFKIAYNFEQTLLI
jgi:hypothetical protein